MLKNHTKKKLSHQTELKKVVGVLTELDFSNRPRTGISKLFSRCAMKPLVLVINAATGDLVPIVGRHNNVRQYILLFLLVLPIFLEPREIHRCLR